MPTHRVFFFLVSLLFCLPQTSSALNPHEVLVLVNQNSELSKELANQYIARRQIPLSNVVYLDIHAMALHPEGNYSVKGFKKDIWDPTIEALAKRGISETICTWVYSADFPFRIKAKPNLSLCGLTFCRFKPPLEEHILNGSYTSPLFNSPESQTPSITPKTFDRFQLELGDKFPIPSMHLAHTGARGLLPDEALQLIKRNAEADSTFPDGAYHFIVSNDIRSKMRAWQYPPTTYALKQLGAQAIISSNFPTATMKVNGLLSGRANINTSIIKKFQPGSMADHLTSHAANFNFPGQTKATDWLARGAYATSGTVIEPKSIWTKFPHAFFFAHQRMGCTTAESFFQAVKSPLETMFIGDPLTAPWKPALQLVTTVHLTNDTLVVQVAPNNQPPNTSFQYEYYIDGRLHAGRTDEADVTLPVDHLEDGYHTVRTVSYTGNNVIHGTFDEQGFFIQNPECHIQLLGLDAHSELDLHHPTTIHYVATGFPTRVTLTYGNLLLAETQTPDNGTLNLNPLHCGAGPVQLQVSAYYKDGSAYRSRPIPLTIVKKNRPPTVSHIAVTTTRAHDSKFTAIHSDPELDPVTITWHQSLLPDSITPNDSPWIELQNAQVEKSPSRFLILKPNEGLLGSCLFSPSMKKKFKTIDVSIKTPKRLHQNHAGGLAFLAKHADKFYFFGYSAKFSGWVLGKSVNGTQSEVMAKRGAPIRRNTRYHLSISENETGETIARVDGKIIFQTDQIKWGKGGVGLYTKKESLLFVPPTASPPCYPENGFKVIDESLVTQDRVTDHKLPIYAVASDAHLESRKLLDPTALPKNQE